MSSTNRPAIRGLGQIVVETTDLDRWRTLAVDILGMTADEGSNEDSLYLRVDERRARFEIRRGETDKVTNIAWDVSDDNGMNDVASRVRDSGAEVAELTRAEADERMVEAGIRFQDPAGHQVEVHHGAINAVGMPVSTTGTRFVTGDQGLGHVVLPTTSPRETYEFYRKTLGFYDRGSFRLPAPGPHPMRIQFMSTCPRHHTLALMPSPADGPGMIHVMLEVETLDMVGEALERASKDEFSISSTLGRHTNDKMVSFYVRAPGGWDIEYGWGGLRVDQDSYIAEQISADSYWGHDWSASEPLGVFTQAAGQNAGEDKS